MNLNIPPQQLSHALKRVQQGELKPEDAARWLLSGAGPAAPLPPAHQRSQTTVAQLMQSLGPPPAEIQRDWDNQVIRLAASFRLTYGRPLHSLRAEDLVIDGENRLSLAPHWLEHLNRERRELENNLSFPAESTRDDQPTNPGLSLASPKSDSPNDGDRCRKSKPARLFTKHRWLGPAAVVVSAASILGATFSLLIPRTSAPIAAKPKPVKPSSRPDSKASSIFSPTYQPMNSPASPPDEVAGLSNLQSIDEAESSLAPSIESKSQEDSSRMNLGLDSFAGSDWVSAKELLPEADFNTASFETGDANEASVDGTPPLMDVPAPETIVDAENPSLGSEGEPNDDSPDSPTTRQASLTSVQLPALPARLTPDNEIESMVLSDAPATTLNLHFPVETGLSLAKVEQGWAVQDTKDNAAIAWFLPNQNELHFRWTEAAGSRSIAKQLASAMIQCSPKDEATRPIFLRPVVIAPAWPIDVSTGDAKAAWPIDVAPPQGPAKLEINFQVPENVLQTWVQPYDPVKIRRCQSIAEFTLDSDPTISIRSRIELRSGSRITLRMRHAAQLDQSFPWQAISSTKIQSAVTQVTDQLARAMSEQSHLKARYSLATTSEKRVLAPQREMIDSVVLRLQMLSKRLAKYDSLIVQLQNASFMSIRLFVTWDEPAEVPVQPIFEMPLPALKKL